MSFWGSYEPRSKAPTCRSPVALHLCLCGLGPFLDYPNVLGMLLQSSGCPLGCGYLLCPYVPHSRAPRHTGVDVGGSDLTEGAWRWTGTSSAETQLHVEPWTSSPSVKWGLTCASREVWPVLHGVIHMKHQPYTALVMLATDMYGAFAAGWALCSVLCMAYSIHSSQP